MLFGLGPAEMLWCLVPLFILFLITGIGLRITDRKGRVRENDDD